MKNLVDVMTFGGLQFTDLRICVQDVGGNLNCPKDAVHKLIKKTDTKIASSGLYLGGN